MGVLSILLNDVRSGAHVKQFHLDEEVGGGMIVCTVESMDMSR